jgi:hypothetical protein
LEQSASFPGSTHPANALFLKTVSFANFAARRAFADNLIFSKILKKSDSFSVKCFLR